MCIYSSFSCNFWHKGILFLILILRNRKYVIEKYVITKYVCFSYYQITFLIIKPFFYRLFAIIYFLTNFMKYNYEIQVQFVKWHTSATSQPLLPRNPCHRYASLRNVLSCVGLSAPLLPTTWYFIRIIHPSSPRYIVRIIDAHDLICDLMRTNS